MSMIINPHVFLWTPAELTLARWWDASDEDTITDSGGDVSQWDDKSPVGDDLLQPTGSAQPVTGTRNINGLNAIDFNGTSHQMNFTLLDMLDKSIFAVVVHDTSVGADALIASSSVNTQLRVGDSGNMSYGSNNPYWATGGTTIAITDAVPAVIAYITDSAGIDFSIDGEFESGGVNLAGTSTSFDKLGAKLATSNDWDGLMGEIVIPDGNLTVDEREKLEGYLAHKWKIALVSGHTYENHPPTL